jgi:hypothetical protein
MPYSGKSRVGASYFPQGTEMTGLVTILLTVVTTLALSTGCVGLVYILRKRTERVGQATDALVRAAAAAEQLRAAVLAYNERMNSYFESATQAVDPLKSVPALMDGLKKLAAAQVYEISLLRAEVKNLRQLIFKKDDVRGFETPGEDERSLHWEMQRIIAENPSLSREEAMQRAIDKHTEGVSVNADIFNLS